MKIFSKKGIIILLLISVTSLVSCQNYNFIVLKPTNDTIRIKRLVLNRHKNPKGYVENYYIELEDYRKIEKQIITDFDIVLKDNIYKAQGIELAWSREKIIKDFFFAYSNDTKLICIDTIDKSEMINITQKYSKNNRLQWIKSELIID